MIQALNPLTCLFPYERTPPLTTTQSLHCFLDAKNKVKQFNFSSSFMQRATEGRHPVSWLLRNVIYIAMTPLRVALSILYGLGHLLAECPRHSLADQPRVIGRIIHATLILTLFNLGSYALPLIYPWAQIRTFNSVDPRSASLYTQRDIPAPIAQGLFGTFGPGIVAENVPLDHMTGLCWGKTLWLAALFLHGERVCKDPEQRLKALTRHYRSGATPEAALLQALGARITEPSTMVSFKPLRIQSIVRGTFRYLTAKSNRSLTEEVDRCYKSAFRAVQSLREDNRMCHLLSLGVRDIRRFAPGHPRINWTDWVSSFFFKPLHGFEGLAHLPDGAYLITSEPSPIWNGPRHAMFYWRFQGGTRGYLVDPNEGFEQLEGREHWKTIAALTGRNGHTKLTLVRIGKRGLLDGGPLDLHRRWVEFFC